MTTLIAPRQYHTDAKHLDLSPIWKMASLWYQRAHQRHQLSQLSPERLQDIGITREQALAEAEKPFWQE